MQWMKRLWRRLLCRIGEHDWRYDSDGKRMSAFVFRGETGTCPHCGDRTFQ